MKLHFKKFGEGEPLIILHGLMGMLDNWQTPAKHLAENFEVFILDQRNHGHSEHSNDFNYDVMADDLMEFVENQDMDQIHLLGHSMGGKTAMKFAQNNPDYVNKLIIVDIAPRHYEVHHQTILDGLLSIDLEVVKSRKEADVILNKYISDFGTRQFLLKNLYWKEREKLAWRFNLDIINRKIVEVGTEINDRIYQGNTLFIKGEKSNYINEGDKEMINIYFPNSQVTEIANSGHWVHAEQPLPFLEQVEKFLL